MSSAPRIHQRSPVFPLLGAGLLAVANMGFLIQVACAPKVTPKAKSVLKDCKLPEDQKGSIQGRWNTLPVPVAFEAEKFPADQITAITAAAETWNKFTNESLGIQVLDYGTEGSPKTSSNAKPGGRICASGLLVNNTFSGPVVLYHVTKDWPYDKRAMAITTTCTIKGSPFNKTYMAIMEINYQEFYGEGQIVPDTQTIVAHEFGHLLGLKHTCHLGSETGMPNCNQEGLDGAYREALMFPSFTADEEGNGEVKRDLHDNDQGRMNCPYEDKRSTSTGG